MPIYEYVCTACGRTFEELVRGEDDPPPRCASCGAADVERQWSVFAARQGSSHQAPEFPGGCGRCGDPNGPCGLG